MRRSRQVRSIDLREHRVSTALWRVDVVPFVPIEGVTMMNVLRCRVKPRPRRARFEGQCSSTKRRPPPKRLNWSYPAWRVRGTGDEMASPEWLPDFGGEAASTRAPRSVLDDLIAYNINSRPTVSREEDRHRDSP